MSTFGTLPTLLTAASSLVFVNDFGWERPESS